MRLRDNGYVAKLPKMLIQRRRRLNPQIVDHNVARTIRKAPTRRPLLKQNPRPIDLLRNQKVQSHEFAVKELVTDFDCPTGLTASDQKSQRIIHAIIGGDLRLRDSEETGLS